MIDDYDVFLCFCECDVVLLSVCDEIDGVEVVCVYGGDYYEFFFLILIVVDGRYFDFGFVGFFIYVCMYVLCV